MKTLPLLPLLPTKPIALEQCGFQVGNDFLPTPLPTTHLQPKTKEINRASHVNNPKTQLVERTT
jgi:hypothetical protein